MNYRHSYHAGGFSDVFKHILLVSLIEFLLRKDKPFCYVDTHAGVGVYNLSSANALKTQEFKGGINKLLQLKNVPFEVVKQYLTLLSLPFYPGSPLFVRKLLRPTDRMILTELHAQDILSLKKLFAYDKQVAVHHLDGYQGLKAFLPPKEKRGLVLIDPPFEETDEFSTLVTQLKFALQRWSTGVYAVWYPIKNLKEVNRFYSDLVDAGIQNILRCELHLPYLASKNFSACGMIVINPPWQWKEEVEQILPWLCEVLSAPDAGKWVVDWVAEGGL